MSNVLWTAEDLEKITNGKWVAGDTINLTIDGVTLYPTDIKKNDLIITMHPNHWPKKYGNSAHHFNRFYESGASAVMAENIPSNTPENKPLLIVENTRTALDQLAKANRQRFIGKVICITGTVGKTSTVEILKYVLEQQKPTYASKPNFNNAPLVALSLAETPPNVTYAIYEFAVDNPELTLAKAKLTRPNIAVITDIQPDHMNKYPNLESIATQKAKLFDGLEKGGIAILNRDHDYYEMLQILAVEKGASKIITYGESTLSDFKLLNYELNQDSSQVTISVNNKHYTYVPLLKSLMILLILAHLLFGRPLNFLIC